MPRVTPPIYSLNGGEVGEEALARLDLERLQFAGALYSNILPRVVGSMTLRPGLEHVADIDFGNVMLLEYAYSGGSTLVPVLSDEEMRVVVDDALVSRTSVSTAVTNGDFASFTGWTDASTGSADASVSGGYLVLTGTSQDTAEAKQTLSVATGDRNVEHGLRVVVARGPVTLKLGTSSGAADLLPAGVPVVLDDGDHSIAFTPTGASVYLSLSNPANRLINVDSCKIESSGTVVIPTPWTSDDLAGNIIRYKQDLDVVYAASGIYQQREILRRSDTSWGVQRYKVDDGPFVVSDGSVSLAPSSYTGDITLTANKPYFDSRMIGRLFRVLQNGQTVVETFASDPAQGAYIRVSGVGSARNYTYTVAGTWTGTVRLQVAYDDGSGNSPGSWSDTRTFTSNGSDTIKASEDNVIKYVRFALQTGDLTSGSVTVTLTYDGGSQEGIARLTAVASTTSASAEVLSRFYALTASFEWDYTTWSDFDGWPAAVETFGGRLYWGKGGLIYRSVPDAYKSFDDGQVGDSAPIVRGMGSNSQRGVLWLLGLQRLIAGTDASEVSIKASSFDDPLTATAWFPVECSTRGCADIRSLKADKDGIFVQTTKIGAFRLSIDQTSFDYTASDLMAMHEKICDGYDIVDLAIQRRPDTVVWFILSNGEARTLTYEPAERVIGWSRIVTDGLIKRVATGRGAGQDAVFFAVERNGSLRLEKMAKLTECRGGTTNCLADGFTRFTATAGQTTFSVP